MPSKPAFFAMTAASACHSTNSFISSRVSSRGISKCVNLPGMGEGATACSPWMLARLAHLPLCISCAKTLLPPSWMASVSFLREGMNFSSVSMAPWLGL